MERCPECDQTVETDQRYCDNCGTKLTPSETPNSTEPEESDSIRDRESTTTETASENSDADSSSQTKSDAFSEDEETWAMLAHLSGLAGLVGIPFGNIVGPLIVWLLKKDEMPFVDRAGKEAINFQISITIYGFIAGALCLILIGFILLPIVVLAYLILTIVASIKAKDGIHYEYPFIFRFIH